MAYGVSQTTTIYKPQSISLYFPTSGAKTISILVKHSQIIYILSRGLLAAPIRPTHSGYRPTADTPAQCRYRCAIRGFFDGARYPALNVAGIYFRIIWFYLLITHIHLFRECLNNTCQLLLYRSNPANLIKSANAGCNCVEGVIANGSDQMPWVTCHRCAQSWHKPLILCFQTP